MTYVAEKPCSCSIFSLTLARVMFLSLYISRMVSFMSSQRSSGILVAFGLLLLARNVNFCSEVFMLSTRAPLGWRFVSLFSLP